MDKPPSDLVGPQVDPRYALELRYNNYVINAFLEALRCAFAHPFTPEQYRYHPTDKGKRQLTIARVWVKRQTKYPALLVETGEGDFSITSLDQEEAYEDIDPDTGEESSITFTGTMGLPVTLTVLAKSATDREKLTDLLSIYVRFVFKQKFNRANIPYLSIRSGPTGEDEDDGVIIYKSEVVIQTQTQFKQKLDLSLLDAVEALNFGGVLMGSSPADLQPNEG